MVLFKKTFKRKFISFPFKKRPSHLRLGICIKKMLELFIITLWLELRGQLYVKYDLPLRSNCERAFEEIKERYKDTSIKVVAVKCEPTEDFVLDQQIYKYTKSFNEYINPKKKLYAKKTSKENSRLTQ